MFDKYTRKVENYLVSCQRVCTHKTKGAFEGAKGANQTYGSLGSLKSSLSFVCDGFSGQWWDSSDFGMIRIGLGIGVDEQFYR